MEKLLHYVWKYKLYTASSAYHTTDGREFEIIDVGIHNTDAGPDFFNAKIKLDGNIWAGNIEIHTTSSDWYKHGHEKNKAYNSVILHVVQYADCQQIQDSSGRDIPQWIMKVPSKITENYHLLMNKPHELPCRTAIPEINPIYISDWKGALLGERLERKTRTVLEWLNIYKNDWNEVFYITLARNFGFGINSDAFERLAKSLPLKYIAKHGDSRLQIESLFLGQAGLLESKIALDDYYSQLQKEYLFLKNKYSLQPLDAYIFKNLRIRPNNFPHIKIVQLAELIRNQQTLFSRILSIENEKDYAPLFISDVSEYWKSHYQFGKPTVSKSKFLSTSAIHILLINTVAPILFAYGKRNEKEIYMERAITLMESLPAEKNSIVNLFASIGIESRNSAESQAIIQLKKEYCDLRKCIFCRIGFKLLSRK